MRLFDQSLAAMLVSSFNEYQQHVVSLFLENKMACVQINPTIETSFEEKNKYEPSDLSCETHFLSSVLAKDAYLSISFTELARKFIMELHSSDELRYYVVHLRYTRSKTEGQANSKSFFPMLMPPLIH